MFFNSFSHQHFSSRQFFYSHGGIGPPIVLVHGLMGRGRTWSDHIEWLKHIGTVYTYDAPCHRGRQVIESHSLQTEYFVNDLANVIALLNQPVRLIGHSMGALHSWCMAADYPQLVSALVIEDMSPDFRGHTTAGWEPWLRALPVEFSSQQEIDTIFGPIAGHYFSQAFDHTSWGWRLHGYPEQWIAIAAQWGQRHYWEQWKAITIPTLLLEAQYTITPPGHMRKMASIHPNSQYEYIPHVGHLIHDQAPHLYSQLVTHFFETYCSEGESPGRQK